MIYVIQLVFLFSVNLQVVWSECWQQIHN